MTGLFSPTQVTTKESAHSGTLTWDQLLAPLTLADTNTMPFDQCTPQKAAMLSTVIVKVDAIPIKHALMSFPACI
jgi:hypothetical protein